MVVVVKVWVKEDEQRTGKSIQACESLVRLDAYKIKYQGRVYWWHLKKIGFSDGV